MFPMVSLSVSLRHNTTESGDWEWGETHWWSKLKAFITSLGFFLDAWRSQAGNKYETVFFRLTKIFIYRDICLSLGLRWRTSCAFLMETQPTEACKDLVWNSVKFTSGRNCPILLPHTSLGVCGIHWMNYFQTLILEKRQMLSSGNLSSWKLNGEKKNGLLF